MLPERMLQESRGEAWAAVRSAPYLRPVPDDRGPAKVVTDLVYRVRAAAAGTTPSELRPAFEGELRRVVADAADQPEAYNAWTDGLDVVGTAYEALISGAQRRSAGQFQTPFWAADLMAAWLLAEPVMLLLDPGVGAGRLLFRALTAAEHQPELIMGFDVDPLCLVMADANLRLRGNTEHTLRELNFLLTDVTGQPDAITCNPPYSRHHAIPSEIKEAIHHGFQTRLGLETPISRLAGLHVLFLVRAIEIAAEAARIAFITPADWVDVNYGREIKRYVLDNAHVEALIVLHDDRLFFDGALTTAAITLLRKEPSADRPTKLIRLGETLPEIDEVLRGVRGEPTSLSVEEIRLSADVKWSRRAGQEVEGTPLTELARVRRGIATGNNKFFVLSETTRQEWGIGLEDLRACVSSPRALPGVEFTAADFDALPDDIARWVIDNRYPEVEEADTPLGRYLRHGRNELDAAKSHLARSRKLWYGLEQRGDCPILFTYLNRERPRFIRNRAAAVPLNTFLIIEPHEGVDPDALCDALNSQAILDQFEASRRNYGGGLWKLEPGEVGKLRVPLPAPKH